MTKMIYTRQPFPGLALVLSGLVLIFVGAKILPEWLERGSQWPALPIWLGVGVIGWAVYRIGKEQSDIIFERRRELYPMVQAKEYVQACEMYARVIQVMTPDQVAAVSAQKLYEINYPSSTGPSRYVKSTDLVDGHEVAVELPVKFLAQWVLEAHPWTYSPDKKCLQSGRDFSSATTFKNLDGRSWARRDLIRMWGDFLVNRGFASRKNQQIILEQEGILMFQLGIEKWEKTAKEGD
jgi:hypothetical protein